MSDTKNLPAVATAPPPAHQSVFSGIQSFENAQRMAHALCSSSLVPKDYQGKENIGNTMIALEMSQRVGASPMAVMQNLHIIHGRPSWSSSFVIAALNSCGKFSPLRFRVEGEGDKKVCTAWAYDKATGDVLEGPPASIEMAKAEGWYGKNGSKWKTMPDLMLRYRAAAFFGRLYAPEILMGMHSEDEVEDIAPRVVEAAPVVEAPKKTAPKKAEPAKEEKDPEPQEAAPVVEPPKKSKPQPKPEPEPEPEPEVVEAEPVETAGEEDEDLELF